MKCIYYADKYVQYHTKPYLKSQCWLLKKLQHFPWKTQWQWLNGKNDEPLTTWWTVYHYPQALIPAWNFSPLICTLGLENTPLYVFRSLHYFANPFLPTCTSQVTRENKRICKTWNENGQSDRNVIPRQLWSMNLLESWTTTTASTKRRVLFSK